MKVSQPTGNRLNRIAVRQASIGVTVGMAAALVLKGYVPLPVAQVHAAMNDGLNMSVLAQGISEGQYRVVMHCPVKNHRVSYHIKAENAGGAHVALEWLMPACRLSALGRGLEADDGQRWFQGEFTCQGNSFRKSQKVSAAGLRQAKEQARTAAAGCRIETVDQTDCPVLDPMCERQSEDFKVEAELERHRLLR